MVRKSGSSRSVSSNSKSLFDVDFEVVLIVVLIVVAIILICFINKKFNKESFIVSKIREHQREHFTEHSNSNENANANSNANGSDKKLYLFYATWCGYSRKYLENELPQLTNMLIAANLSDKFLQRDVETPEGKEDASLAGVTGLPSVYKFENGVFTKIDSKNLQAMVDWLSN